MSGFFNLKKTLGRDYNVDLGDVRRAKQALRGLGFYKMPDHGLTEYPDESLFEGIEDFQQTYGLRRDGVMKPKGETEAALNHVLNRKRVQGGRKAVNSERLFGLFDRFSSPDFHDDPRDFKCRATGTCDNIY